jgi:hypothetical protein
MKKVPWRTGPDRHGTGVMAVVKISVNGRRATVWRDSAKRYAVTFDDGMTSIPPLSFGEYYSQAVAIHVFREMNRC